MHVLILGFVLGACTPARPPAVAAPDPGLATADASASPALSTPARTSATVPTGCTIFPADNVWHAPVDRLPVRADSTALVASIGATRPVHPDFGAGLIDGAPFGMPVTVVPPGQPGVPVGFDYAAESDRGPYPIPRNVLVEGGPAATGDRHVILYDPAGCRLFELFNARPQPGGGWHAGSGAIFDLRSNRLRPARWTSADAAGLPILPGLVRYEEVAAGRLDHAIRVTVPVSRNTYLWPARHAASARGDANLPPMGLRLRLRAGVDVSGFPVQARVVAEALKRYGVIVADNGSPWFLSGTQDERWNNDALNALKTLHGSDFEAVDTAGLMVDPDSAAVRR